MTSNLLAKKGVQIVTVSAAFSQYEAERNSFSHMLYNFSCSTNGKTDIRAKPLAVFK